MKSCSERNKINWKRPWNGEKDQITNRFKITGINYLFSKLFPIGSNSDFNFLSPFHIIVTTRKLEKSNGITDGNIPSVINTDGHNSVSKSVGIYRRNHSVGNAVGIYRQNISVGIYRRLHQRNIHFVWKYATTWWRQAILPTESTEGFKLW